MSENMWIFETSRKHDKPIITSKKYLLKTSSAKGRLRLLSAKNPNAAIKIAFAGVGNPLKLFTCFVSMLNLANLYAENTATKKAAEHIAKIGFDPQFGARPIKRVIQKEVLNELSKMILAEKVDRKATIVVDEKNGELVFRNK